MEKSKWDLKCFITASLVITLELVVLAIVVSAIAGIIPMDNPLVNSIVIVLFSNAVTMVLTYFFTKKGKEDNTKTEV